jgi:hypothetical protein
MTTPSSSFFLATPILLLLLLCTFFFQGTKASNHAVIPSAKVTVYHPPSTDGTTQTQFLVTQAKYGPVSPMESFYQRNSVLKMKETSDSTRIVVTPTNNPLLCSNDTSLVSNDIVKGTKGSVLVVPRGTCSFQFKTWVAQSLYQASGLIIYNTLGSSYHLNETIQEPTEDDVLWPLQYIDYDCSKGEADIPSNLLSFDPLPYNSKQNDLLLSGNTDQNLCLLHSKDSLRNCQSRKCLVAHTATNTNTTTTTEETIKVCCAWDMLIEPVGDRDLLDTTRISIPTVFMKMKQGDQLVEILNNYKGGTQQQQASIRSRYKPYYNPSSMLIWMLGVFVAALASYLSASEYHNGIRKYIIRRRSQRQAVQQQQQQSSQQRLDQMTHQRTSSLQEEKLELEPIHALMFVVMASTSLLVLFFFKVSLFVAFYCVIFFFFFVLRKRNSIM